MANVPRGAICISVTNDLHHRVEEHKSSVGSKHVRKYNIQRLVYFETFQDIDLAISREKQLKRWRRAGKTS